MRLGRSAALSDAGRRRRRNEDSFVREPPLFVVADGMGGALAGELASRLAASALEEAGRAGAPIDIVAAIQEGNKRINERSIADPATAGMGTTVTAVLVGDGRLSIGHVGDSRAYRLRDGALDQLTADHSLVAELVRTGQLSPEEAEGHPQRAVITRALGTDANVDVDFFEVGTAPGDLYLLCSDGLTTMLGDAEVRDILRRDGSDLEALTRSLVAAANAAGGEDNITVVCFEIVDGDGSAAEPDEQTREAATTATADEDTLSGLDAIDPVGPETLAFTPGETAAAAARQASGTREAPTTRGPSEAPTLASAAAPRPRQPPPAAPRRRRRRRKLPWIVAFLVLVAVAAAAALAFLSRIHFVGADAHGNVVVYQGVPWDLASNVHLYRASYISRVRTAQLSQAERLRLFDHGLHSRNVALNSVRRFEHELLR